MPTPVGTARQCLTEEAALTLDEAVAVARRRSHAQTTSLHIISSLLSMPSSILREACSHSMIISRKSPTLQFRALDLSVSVSLDRLQTTKNVAAPPVSNSLMAAIKRGQASQRRNPEFFHIYQQNGNNNLMSSSVSGIYQQNVSNNLLGSSVSGVKIELKQFVLAILDDPIVSRVFGEAGFRSPDIKMAVLSPGRFSSFSKTKCPPLFLCNLSDVERGRRGFSFPFSEYLGSGRENVDDVDENSRRITEVLLKKTGKNPLLVGVCASEALKCFMECLGKKKGGVLSDEISGLSFVSIEKEVFEFVSKGGSDEAMKMKLKEVDDGAQEGELLVNYGDLRVFVESGLVDCERFVVLELSRLVEVHGGRLRLIGVTSSDDTYRKFVDRFASIEKDWDLQLLPITSSRTYSMGGGGYPKSSLLGSFVPFGGFFSLPSELETIRSSKVQFTGRCSVCNENYEREVSAALKEISASSVSGSSTANIPSWLHKAECSGSKSPGAQEAKDGKMVSAASFMELQKKWNDICQHLHSSASSEMSGARPQVSGNQNVARPHSLEAGSSDCAEYVVQSNKKPSDMRNIHNPTCSVLNERQPLDRMVGKPRISVTTELQLAPLYPSKDKGLKELNSREFRDFNKHLSGSVSSERASFDPTHLRQSVSSSIPHLGEKYDSNDFKQLYRALTDKVYWQEEAISLISQVISRCRSGHGKPFSSSKGNIWLSFLGPDKVAKRKTSVALSEILYGSIANLITVDLSSNRGSTTPSSLFSANNLIRSDEKFRGMMVVDYIAEELKRRPNSVVLLEDIDNADVPLQNSLSQALKTGKFPNSHGREISISNNIFVMTSSVSEAVKDPPSGKPSSAFPEERVLAARDLQMRIVVEDAHSNSTDIHSSNIEIMGTRDVQTHVSRLKRILHDNSDFNKPKRARNEPTWSLDLNLPVQEMEDDNGDSESHSYSNDESWLEEIFGQLNENVVFKPFNFDALAEKILMDIRAKFQEIIGADPSLEIEAEVILQIIAASWLSDNKSSMVNWMEQVLCRSFLEAKQKWNLTNKTVMKLVTCEGIIVKDHAPGILLPARINVS
ncbi:hypothetical protein Leryth_009379 [Lithospermum erythrorhizon]|nr:hypothetical protein Leryth_009379 [Lithospermum erythrorhizon]